MESPFQDIYHMDDETEQKLEVALIQLARMRKHDNWDEHPDHPVADWQYEVANGDTRRGYWAWARERIICQFHEGS